MTDSSATIADVMARMRRQLKLPAGARLVRLPAGDHGGAVVARAADVVVKARLDGAIMAEERALQRAAHRVAAHVLPSPPNLIRMAFVRGRTATSADVATIAAALATLHSIRAPKARLLVGGSNALSALAIAKRCCETLAKRSTVPRSLIQQTLVHLRDHEANLHLVDGADTPMLCHGDVRAPNIRIVGGRATLLDFGLAGQGDPALDLARFCAYENLDAAHKLTLMIAYRDGGGQVDAIDRAWLYLSSTALVLTVQALTHRALHGQPLHLERLQSRLSASPKRAQTRKAFVFADLPRMAHVPGSRMGHDDLVATPAQMKRLRQQTVTVTEKLDGIAVGFYRDEDGDLAVLMKRQWRQVLNHRCVTEALWFARANEEALSPFLKPNAVVMGEWLWHRLRCRYSRLLAPCVLHTWVVGGVIRPSRDAFAKAGFQVVGPHFHGQLGQQDWSALCPKTSVAGGRAEGIVIEAAGNRGGLASWKWVAPWYRQPLPTELTGERNRVLTQPYASLATEPADPRG